MKRTKKGKNYLHIEYLQGEPVQSFIIFINCFVLFASRLSTLVLSIAKCNSRGAYLERLLFYRPVATDQCGICWEGGDLTKLQLQVQISR